MIEFAELYSLVWRKRRELVDLWPLPDIGDALCFCVCESCELLDAWLRITRPQYKRNHVKDADIHGEAADTAIMLMTAIGDNPPRAWGLSDFQLADAEADIRTVVHHCDMALETWHRYEEQPRSHLQSAYRAWCLLALYDLALLEPDLLAGVERRLARIEQRVKGQMN
jgi:hypothetical protein